MQTRTKIIIAAAVAAAAGAGVWFAVRGRKQANMAKAYVPRLASDTLVVMKPGDTNDYVQTFQKHYNFYPQYGLDDPIGTHGTYDSQTLAALQRVEQHLIELGGTWASEAASGKYFTRTPDGYTLTERQFGNLITLVL